MKVEVTQYEEKGFANRIEYLEDLADSYGVEDHIVWAFADLLGPSEDFDGLVNMLEDYAASY